MTTNYAGKRIWNATCRSWCTGHDGLGVDWHEGPSWATVLTDGSPPLPRELGYAVSVHTGQDEEGVVFAQIDAEDEPKLTPGQAREIAGQLLEAAEWIEHHRDAPLRSSVPTS
jgi:hypothetical protein